MHIIQYINIYNTLNNMSIYNNNKYTIWELEITSPQFKHTI